MRHIFILFGILVLTGCAPVTVPVTPLQTDESVSSVSSVVPSDERILLTKEEYEKLREYLHTTECDESLFGVGIDDSFADPTEKVAYTGGPDYGFSADLPFNPAWGTSKYKVLPYEENEYQFDDGLNRWVAFGPVGLGEGCGVMRIWEIQVLPLQGSEQIIREVRDTGLPFAPGYEPKVVTIGDHEVVRYGEGGFCDSPVLQVIGPIHTYRVSMVCAELNDKNFAVLEDIARSMTFSANNQ